MMAFHNRIRLAVVLVVLLPTALNADVLCTLCFTIYRAPGGGQGEGAGYFRVKGCPACQPKDCKNAAADASGLRSRYSDKRLAYEGIKDQYITLSTVPKSVKEDLAKRKAELSQLERAYAALHAACPREVPKTNVWDGTTWPNGVGDSPVTPPDPSTRNVLGASKAAANDSADSYDRLAQTEEQMADTIVGFLDQNPDVSGPPTGYNGERYQLTRSYSDVAAAHRKEAKSLNKDRPGKPDPKLDLTKVIVPKFPETKLAQGDKDYIRNAGIGARSRLEGNIYLLAYMQSRELYREAQAAENPVAAKLHARSTVEFAWQAQGYAKWAAEHQHKSDAVHQKLLDESLTAAAKKGLPIATLLEKFQARIKESGLPAHVNDALTAAGANADERADAKKRMLALTPEAVETVLKERRARIAREPEAPDAMILDTQLLIAQVVYHAPPRK